MILAVIICLVLGRFFMLFTSTTPVEKNGWEQFWDAIVDFFMTKDSTGMNYLARIGIAVGIIIVAYILIKLICHFIKKALGVKRKGPEIDVSARLFVVQVIKVLLWVGVAFAVIAVLKIDTTGLAGVTSAVTVALGLALQDIVVGFASGLLVIHHHIFLAGEFVSITNSYGTQEGIVDRVQVFFTYLKTPAGQELTIPNSAVLKATVTNYTRSGERRMDYNVGVAYNSDIAKVKKVLEDLIKDDPRRMKERPYEVYLYELGAYSVGVRVRCWTTPDNYWPLFNNMSEMVLLAFNKNGIYIPSSTDRLIMKD